MKSFLWWVFAVLFTLATAVFQRLTGPTNPLRGAIELNNQTLKYKLPRSAENTHDAKIFVVVPDTTVKAEICYKRYKSHDEWTIKGMTRNGDTLVGWIEKQPAAGKMLYCINLQTQNGPVLISGTGEQPVTIRFKGPVPAGVLIPHILLMFLAMLFSTRTGIEALRKGKRIYPYAWLTLIFLFFGGFVFGCLVQYYAFGVYWAGIPLGYDLTDNKTLLALVLWIVAVVRLWKNRENRTWALVASIVMLAVYLIPHSLFGSEIDYTQQLPK